MYCAGCAVVAADWRGGVTFASDEIEHLRALAEYVGRTLRRAGSSEGLEILKGKLS